MNPAEAAWALIRRRLVPGTPILVALVVVIRRVARVVPPVATRDLLPVAIIERRPRIAPGRLHPERHHKSVCQVWPFQVAVSHLLFSLNPKTPIFPVLDPPPYKLHNDLLTPSPNY